MAWITPFLNHAFWLAQWVRLKSTAHSWLNPAFVKKTHYLDACGEHPWIKNIIANYHTQARKNKMMIVNSCSFNSVPSDLGVFMLSKYAKEKHDMSELAKVKISVTRIAKSYFVGTMQLSVLAFTDASLTSEQKSDPYLLVTRQSIDKSTLHTLERGPDFSNLWQSYFVMSGYGHAFTFKESMSFDFLTALIMTSIFYTLGLLIKVPFLCEKVRHMLPDFGGPNAASRAKGVYDMEFINTLSERNEHAVDQQTKRRTRSIVKTSEIPDKAIHVAS
ncbi:hypothetical protein MAM1_0138d06343 [Mucor ambiguus]|uniref:Uncharacterized protein n=1 Tax=Mucor ambiguus TaxID=91626 RepID=A0A0C9MXF8_9FUNG|nr:hypothetical protein MAM1_0138d06343 [Mucor ambiguus]